MHLRAQHGRYDHFGLGTEPEPPPTFRRHVRLDSPVGASRQCPSPGRTRRQACHRDAQGPPEFGVGVTGETEVALTEEFEMMSTAPARGGPGADDTSNVLPVVLELSEAADLVDDLPEPPPRAQHGARERGHAREL